MAPKMFDTINMDDIVKATKGGYLYVTTTPDHSYGEQRKDRKKKYVYLHRAVKEKELGRYLKPEEQVDHKDGDKTNNAPSNLEVKNLGSHQKDHALNGNSFWKKSPRNKPGCKTTAASVSREAAQRVVLKFLSKHYLTV